MRGATQPLGPRTPRWVDPLVLAIGLVIAIVAAWGQSLTNRAAASERFEAVAERASTRLLDRLRLYERGLRGLRGVILASGGPEITRRSFLTYLNSRDLPEEFPGAHGFAYVRRLRAGDEPALLEAMKVDGVDDFVVHTLGEVQDDRFVVIHAGPVDANRAAIGLDIASDPDRRAAAERACATGAVTATAPLVLIQTETSGLLLLLPIYRVGAPLDDVEARRAACFGWAAVHLVVDEVLAESAVEQDAYTLALTDVTDADHPIELRSASNDGDRVQRRFVQPIYGRRWDFDVRSTSAFYEQLNLTAPTTVFAIGALLSALVTALVHLLLLLLSRQRQIHAHERRLAGLVERSSDAILSETPEGVITSWNRAAERLFGYRLDEALGRRYEELLRPEVRGAASATDLGVTTGQNDVRCQRRDGSSIDVAITISPITDRNGAVIGVGRMLRDIGPQKDAERRLQEFNVDLEREVLTRTAELEGASRQLRTVLDVVPAAIAYWDRNLVNRSANAAFRRWVEVEPNGRHLRELVDAGLSPSIAADIEATLRGEARGREEALDLESGRPTRVRARYVIDGGGGEVRGVYLIAQDITELYEERTRLHDTVEGTDSGTWEWNFQTGELRVNERWAAILGYTREELAPITTNALLGRVHPDDLPAASEARRRFAAGETDSLTVEARLRHRDGRWVWVRDCGRVASWTTAGDPLWIRGVRQDTTGQHEAQRRLAESEAFLERAGRLAQIGGWQLHVDTQRLEWTRETKRIHEVPLDYAPTVEEALAFYPEEARRQITESLDRAILEGVGYDLVLPFVTAAGRSRWVRTICEVDVNGEGESRRPTRLSGAIQDITRQREAEDGLREATRVAERASAAKSEFVANMSHEIRTPLHAILGVAHLLERSTLSPDQRGYVAQIHLAGQSLLDVVNDVLDLSKIEAGELTINPAPFDLRALIGDFEALFGPHAARKGLNLAVCLPYGLPERYIGDAARLRQILTNLVTNAIKFTEVGGVEVRLEIESRGIDHTRLRFIVRDTGIGMSPEALSQIFLPFVPADSSTTRRYGGTGLGLSIVQRLTALMGGEVSVVSAPGKGSEFKVTLTLALSPPTDQGSSAPSERRPAARGDALAGIRILVVDDSEINRDIACHILASEGATVSEAGDGREACRRLAADPTGVDVVLMDLQMPIMDGNEATRRIRHELGLVHLPVIALTAGTLRAAKQRAFDAGIDDFLSKPLDPRILIQSIASHVERARLEVKAGPVNA